MFFVVSVSIFLCQFQFLDFVFYTFCLLLVYLSSAFLTLVIFIKPVFYVPFLISTVDLNFLLRFLPSYFSAYADFWAIFQLPEIISCISMF